MKDRTFDEPPTLDTFTANNPLNAVMMTYNALVQRKPGYLKPTSNEIVPDEAESWEISGDGLQITLKLRQGVTWHNKPPVNGRPLDIDDVVFTWERFLAKSSGRSSVANSVNPTAPVLSLTATDSRTVVLKLKEPIVYALGLLAQNNSGGLIILPRETDSEFDPRGEIIGTGPFMLTKIEPSVGFTLERHPGAWDKNAALVDKIELPIISEYSQAIAQLKAGNIYHMGSYGSTPKVASEDILTLKRDQPKLLIYTGDFRTPFASTDYFFGWLPEGESIFLDERVRQAVSMGHDRDLWMEIAYNVAAFEAEGLPLETRWNAHVRATEEGWWLDPQGKDFGPNAKYFQHDVAEAKKLLAAAGHPDGFETVSSYPTERFRLGKNADLINGMLQDIGVRTTPRVLDYFQEYVPNYRDASGQWEGLAFHSFAGAATGYSSAASLANAYWSKSGARTFVGMSLSGKNDKSGDPEIDGILEKARVEQDTERRRKLVFDAQRHLAGRMYHIPPVGLAPQFRLAWPAVQNFMTFQSARNGYYLWLDQTKPPFTG